MARTIASSVSIGSQLSARLRDYAALTKLRLTSLVVFTSVIGYLIGAGDSNTFWLTAAIALGGLLVTGSANTINQIIEKDIDPKMERTANRPLAADRMGLTEAILLAGLLGVVGIGLISYYFNPIAGVLSALSLFSYAFVYTPMKRISPVAVFIGAIPGGLPPMIGYVAATGQLDFTAWLLFCIQFFWQFPHFWAIAWLAFDDYKKADIMLLPSAGGKDSTTTWLTLLYSCILVVVGLMPWIMGISGDRHLIVALLVSIPVLASAVRLVREKENAAARAVLYSSFAYLPLILLFTLIDQI